MADENDRLRQQQQAQQPQRPAAQDRGTPPEQNRNQQRADRAAEVADERAEEMKKAPMRGTPSTAADAKRMMPLHGTPVDVQEGETRSDAEKRMAQEAFGEDLGSADASSVESGALMEQGVKDAIDLEHPAVDNRPRYGLPSTSNQIDFNDPRDAGRVAPPVAPGETGRR